MSAEFEAMIKSYPIEKLQALYILRSYDETELELDVIDLARPHLTDFELNGDKFGSHGIYQQVEYLTKKLARLEKQVAQAQSALLFYSMPTNYTDCVKKLLHDPDTDVINTVYTDIPIMMKDRGKVARETLAVVKALEETR